MSSFTVLEEQIRECFGRVVYTHKTHEKMADACSKTLRNYKLGQIAVSSLTALGALSTVFSDKLFLKLGTAVLSVLTAWLAGFMKSFDPGGTAQKHREAAASLWGIRESYLSLLTDLRMKAISEEQGIKQRDQLQGKLAAIYKAAPQTNGDAYAAAQVALQENEEYTFSDTEIDKFVPASLRKNTEC